MQRLLAIVLLGFVVRGEIVDRAAITVGRQVVTELELEEEVRVTAFFNRVPPVDTPQQRRAAADRLVRQLLVAREMRLSHYPDPSGSDVQNAFTRIRDGYTGPLEFNGALTRYKLNENILKAHLARQISTLRFIEYRFRPELGISETDLQNYYNRKIKTWTTDHPGVPVPDFNRSRDSLRTALIAARTDDALDGWLKETGKQVPIAYLEQDLRQ